LVAQKVSLWLPSPVAAAPTMPQALAQMRPFPHGWLPEPNLLTSAGGVVPLTGDLSSPTGS